MVAVLFLMVMMLVPDEAAGDELSLLLDVYASDVRDLRSRNASTEERQSFREDWLDRFLHGMAENPNSPSRRMVIAKAVGLANSTGNWDVSKTLTVELAQSSSLDEENVFWLIEQGEVSFNAYRTSGDSAQLNDAISSLRKGLLIATDESKSVPPDVTSKAVVGGVLLANVLAESGRGSGEEVNELLATLTKLSDGLPPEVFARLESSGYGPERLVVTRLDVAMKLLRQDLAVAALEELLKMAESNSLSSHFSSHLLRYADVVWPEKGGEYRKFLADWVSRAGVDSWRGYVYFAIMSSASADKSCDEVLLYGESILGESGQALRDSDATKTNSKVTYMSEVYGMLVECCMLMGMPKKADEYKALLVSLAPGDRRLRELNIATDTVVPQKPIQFRSVGWFARINIAIFVASGLYFIAFYTKKALWSRLG